MPIPLRKFVAPEFVYGTDARRLAGRFAVNLGASRIFLVTDPTVRQYAWFDDILESLEADELLCDLFDRVTINPKDTECAEGARQYAEAGCDLILAVGGGSVIDCAKGIGILTTNPGPVSRYEGVDEIQASTPPLICIPTTAGSAADISQFAIITNTAEAYKMAIVSKMLVPDLSLTDPWVTLTLDRENTLDAGLDVLAHAIESYASNAASAFTRLHALESVRLVLRSLPSLAGNLQDLSLRDAMMQASLQAGLSFSNASLGLIHAVAHALGGRFNLIHGELNGMLLSAVTAFNYAGAPREYDALARAIETELGWEPDTLPRHLDRFICSVRANRSLRDAGVSREAFQGLIPWILNDPCVVTNPVAVTAEDVMALYERL